MWVDEILRTPRKVVHADVVSLDPWAVVGDEDCGAIVEYLPDYGWFFHCRRERYRPETRQRGYPWGVFTTRHEAVEFLYKLDVL